jgi:dihydroneopterin aldolase
MAGGRSITIVKLGGSFAASPTQLKLWLGALAGCPGHVVLVPGGGPFADAVRGAQQSMGVDDSTAHYMALLAMEQYGCALASLGAGMTLAASAAALREALRRARIPIWSPRRMVLEAPDIPASWEVTADSLAAWLAGKIAAPRLLLVKRWRPAAARVDARDLVAQGLTDSFFPDFLAASGAEGSLAGPADHDEAAAALRAGLTFGTLIDLH